MLMPPIKRKWKRRKITLLIPGGWHAVVPQIIEDTLEVFTRAWADYLYNARVVKDRFKARKLAQKMLQNVFDYAWRVLLSQSIFYFAKQYAKRYPDAMINDSDGNFVYTLAGFDPSVMQRAFVPAQKPGVDGLKFVDSMLREMHDAIST